MIYFSLDVILFIEIKYANDAEPNAMSNDLTISLKLPYKNQKIMKKLYGKHLGREIAIGRKLIKLISMNYGSLTK